MILEDDDPVTVERMLNFLYTREYNDQAPAQIEELVNTSKNAAESLLEVDDQETSSFANLAVVNGKEIDRDFTTPELSRALTNIAVYAQKGCNDQMLVADMGLLAS